jgi:hypothetical protein
MALALSSLLYHSSNLLGSVGDCSVPFTIPHSFCSLVASEFLLSRCGN